VIGYEDVDPNPGTCPALWFCSYYRFSDAAIGRLTSRDRRKGYLARPAYRSYKESGTINLNSYGSYIRVDGTTGDIVQNSAIDGIGSTTGWLYGNVVATCVDFKPFDNKMRRCFYLAENKVDEGDSGGPVFYYDGQGIATAAGIIAARGGAPWITASDGMWFSKWSYVESELTGSAPKPAWISIVASDVSVTPTATIMGPSGIKPNTSCYWYVSSNVAYSGAEWRVNGTLVGTGPDIYYSASSSFALTVQLFAAVGFGASKSVTVGAEQNTCAVE
jgi:hypothetical protein